MIEFIGFLIFTFLMIIVYLMITHNKKLLGLIDLIRANTKINDKSIKTVVKK